MTVQKIRGFTLIEVLIVVAILGLIAAIGYPSYRDQVMKARRSDGIAALLELADRMERHYSDVGTYRQADDSLTVVDDVFPSFSSEYYSLTIDTQDKVKFTVSAVPKLGSSQEKDKCGTFTLTSQGDQSISGVSLSKEDCWR